MSWNIATMFTRAIALSLIWCCAFGSAHAAPVRLLCAGALTGAMETLIPEFEAATGHKVVVVFDIINSIAGRIREGQVLDLAIETPAQWESLAKEGKLDPTVREKIASVKWALLREERSREA
jgi:ABC-type molybdate transport system substrate-binding protein